MNVKATIAVGLPALVLAIAIVVLARYDPNEPEVYADAVEHFKYGSIGAETELRGVPYALWRVLPDVFPDLLPPGPGRGYERFGFIYESPSHPRPIGVSYRRHQVPLVGLNCATCHTGTIRDAPDAPRRIVLGMPSHQIDLQRYLQFLFAVSRDPRFDTNTILAAIARVDPDFSWSDRLLYRMVVLPLTRRAFAEVRPDFAWQDRRPRQGPGRVDTFNPYKVLFRMPMDGDDTVGTADLPPLFNQRPRTGLRLHWDGNNDLETERDKSAAIGAGCTAASIDLPAIARVEDWIRDLQPPPFPAARVDSARASQGAALFERHCAACHTLGAARTGTVVPIGEIGTDPERLESFTPALAERMNTLGTGTPWRFSHFRKTDGYVAMPLDGIWLRAPYLHNGSVPTLRDLLEPPDKRPVTFVRGYDVYDYVNVGFVSAGRDAEAEGVVFDTHLRGNGNGGHLYGTALSPGEKAVLLEFLKTR